MARKLNTICVQGGWQPKKGEPRVLPIYQSTTFKYETSEQMADLFDLKASGYFYTRLQNPTNDAVANKIAELEGGVAAMLTSSGMAANFLATFNIAGCGDHIVSSASIYGGTFNLFSVTMKRMGIEFTFVNPDCTEEELLAKAGNGVYITDLSGLHAGANPISGDFSLQSAGFMIRQGQKAEYVKSFTVAGNFYDLLKNITALASNLELPGMGSFGSPTVRVDGLTIAGK